MYRRCRYAQRSLADVFRIRDLVGFIVVIVATVIVWGVGQVSMATKVSLVSFALFVLYRTVRSFQRLNRAPRPFSNSDKYRLLAFLADHRTDFSFPMRLIILPLHDPVFAEKIAETFYEGGWEVSENNNYSVPPRQEEGIWIFGTNQPCKELAAQAFASALGIKAELDNSSPGWPYTVVSFGQ